MNSIIEHLTGRWQTADGQISVVLNIKPFGKGFRVSAYDESDGEKLSVSKVKWDGETLEFETLTPSTKWRTKNRIKLISEKEIVHELTHWEKWKKVQDRTGQDVKMQAPHSHCAACGRRRASKAVTPSAPKSGNQYQRERN
jgi:hypothetical protein